MLKAHGDYILPKNVPANEFLNLEGSKISTSKNWAVWLPDYLKDFPEKQKVFSKSFYHLLTMFRGLFKGTISNVFSAVPLEIES